MPGIIGPLSRKRQERQEAEALQLALARLERLPGRKAREREALAESALYLDPETRDLLRLAAALRTAAAPSPEITFAATLENRLRSREMAPGKVVLMRRTVRWPAVATAAACLLAVVVVGRGAAVALPGDALYGVKRAGESVRVGLVSGRSEALLRLDLGQSRLVEVQGLVSRQRDSVSGVPGAVVAAAGGMRDPRIVKLIEDTLREAAKQISAAAVVLIKLGHTEDLRELAEVAQSGRETVTGVVSALVTAEAPILDAGKELEAIEAQAIEAIAAAPEAPAPTPVPDPCATPTPSPTPSQTPKPTATPKPRASASPSPAPSATAQPTPTPTPTPCPTPTLGPSPTPAPKQTQPTAEPPPPTPEPSPQASWTPEPEESSKPESRPGTLGAAGGCWTVWTVRSC